MIYQFIYCLFVCIIVINFAKLFVNRCTYYVKKKIVKKSANVFCMKSKNLIKIQKLFNQLLYKYL